MPFPSHRFFDAHVELGPAPMQRTGRMSKQHECWHWDLPLVFMRVCVCVWKTCVPRSQFLIRRGTQHVTGTVPNEATSDMGSKG